MKNEMTREQDRRWEEFAVILIGRRKGLSKYDTKARGHKGTFSAEKLKTFAREEKRRD